MIHKFIRQHLPVFWIVLFTIIVVGSLIGLLMQGRGVHKRSVPLLYATHQIKIEVTLAHLWLEEMLAGDREEDIESVRNHFSKANWFLKVIEIGGEDESYTYLPTKSERVLALTQKVISKLEPFILLAERRYNETQNTIAGSLIDQQFDRQFFILSELIESLSHVIHNELSQKLQEVENVQVLLVILITILAVLLCFTMYRFQRKQVRHEKELLNNQQLLEMFFNAIDDGIMIHPLKAKGFSPFTYVNDTAAKRLGYSREELLQLTAGDITIAEDSAKHGDPDSRVQLLNKKHFILESVHITKKGERIPVEINANILEVEGEEPLILSVVRDITERKKAADAHKEMEFQLQQAQKMESVGRLAGGVAHDFNNILSVILGYAELSLKEMNQEGETKYLKSIENILSSGKRAARLTQQLLAFSRKQIIQPVILDVNEEIDEFCKMLNRLLGEDIEISLILEKGTWPVKLDRSQFEQVLLNLAVNAREAMPNGGTFTIETANITLDEQYVEHHLNVVPGDYVTLSISDNGIGMEKEVVQKIFEPFYTTKGVDKGTGLGLSTVYGVVRQNNGNVMVYSEPGKGTTFKLYFQRSREEPSIKINARANNHTRELHGTETLLLVEDDEALREMFAENLSRAGYTILTAKNGKNALNVFESYYGKINLLLTDVVMPKMGGVELAKKMTELDPELKVLFMSGYTENIIVRQGVLKEGVNFSHKPITPDALLKKVYSLLQTS